MSVEEARNERLKMPSMIKSHYLDDELLYRLFPHDQWRQFILDTKRQRPAEDVGWHGVKGYPMWRIAQ